MLAQGITFIIGLYGLTNIAIATNLLPTTGIPMPFVSYGGSSLIVNLFGVGILLNICQQSGVRALRLSRGNRNGHKARKKLKIR